MTTKVRKCEKIGEIGEQTRIGTKDEGLRRGQTGHHRLPLEVKVGTQASIKETIEDVITKMNVKTSEDMDIIIMNQGDAVEITIEEIDVTPLLNALKRPLKK